MWYIFDEHLKKVNKRINNLSTSCMQNGILHIAKGGNAK